MKAKQDVGVLTHAGLGLGLSGALSLARRLPFTRPGRLVHGVHPAKERTLA